MQDTLRFSGGSYVFALIAIMALTAIPVVGLAGLDSWVFGDSPGLPEPGWAMDSVGVAMLNGETPTLVVGAMSLPAEPRIPIVMFDGEEWHPQNYDYAPCVDTKTYGMAESAEGAIWLKFWYIHPESAYIDSEGYHENDLADSWLWQGISVDCPSWRGTQFLVLGQDAFSPARGAVLEYQKPPNDRILAYLRVTDDLVFGGCACSGDFLAIDSHSTLTIIDFADWSEWEVIAGRTEKYRCLRTTGANSYFWGKLRSFGGFAQINAAKGVVEEVAWAEEMSVTSQRLDHRGLWVFGQESYSDRESPLFVGFWSFQGHYLDAFETIPPSVGQCPSFTPTVFCISRHMTHSADGALWFATEKAVCRWTPDPDLIPMPYEARVEAQAKEGGSVEVEIEFDNLRIIRNDADLHLKIEFLREGDTEPVPLFESYSVYHEFQPQETFYYSSEYVPPVLPPVDRIRYSVYTTYIDLNAPQSLEGIITSNVAMAEVRLD